MSTVYLVPSVPTVPQPWQFEVGRLTRIHFGQETYNESTKIYGARDISAARWEVRLRAYVARSSTELLLSKTLDKAATTGWVDDLLDPGDTAYTDLVWEAVLVDTATVRAGCPSGYEEQVLFRFVASVLDAPAGAVP